MAFEMKCNNITFFQTLAMSAKWLVAGKSLLAVCLIVFTILGGYSWMIVVSTFSLIREKENESSVQDTPIEISVITPSVPVAPVTDPRTQYLRSPSLPAYENVVSEESTKDIETPPPNYDETVTKFHYV